VTFPLSPLARALAMDQDQPTVNSTSTKTATALKIRSALPMRRNRTRRSGNARRNSLVALRRGGGELERLSSIRTL
jgi:hypothetical protein